MRVWAPLRSCKQALSILSILSNFLKDLHLTHAQVRTQVHPEFTLRFTLFLRENNWFKRRSWYVLYSRPVEISRTVTTTSRTSKASCGLDHFDWNFKLSYCQDFSLIKIWVPGFTTLSIEPRSYRSLSRWWSNEDFVVQQQMNAQEIKKTSKEE